MNKETATAWLMSHYHMSEDDALDFWDRHGISCIVILEDLEAMGYK